MALPGSPIASAENSTTQPRASSMPPTSCTSPGEIKNRSPADTFLEWSSIRCCPRT